VRISNLRLAGCSDFVSVGHYSGMSGQPEVLRCCREPVDESAAVFSWPRDRRIPPAMDYSALE
jgi:hypothetical protein